MKMTLSFRRLDTDYPHEDKPVLVAWNIDNVISGHVFQFTTLRDIEFDNKHNLYWTYFDFVPEDA
jgi:hypothetical protein